VTTFSIISFSRSKQWAILLLIKTDAPSICAFSIRISILYAIIEGGRRCDETLPDTFDCYPLSGLFDKCKAPVMILPDTLVMGELEAFIIGRIYKGQGRRGAGGCGTDQVQQSDD
jgi:hypothetical protein